MKFTNRIRSRVLPGFALLTLLTVVGVSRPARADNPGWDEAFRAYTSGNFKLAAEKWESWIADQPDHDTSSARYNLAAAYCRLNDFGRGMNSLLRSAAQRSNPRRILSELELAAAVQRRIGIKEGPAEKLPFTLYYLLNPNITAYLFAAGGWLLALAFLVWLNSRRRVPVTAGLSLVGATLLLIGATGWLNREFGLKPAVIDLQGNGVAATKNPGENATEKLIELPAGTLVGLAAWPGDAKYVEIQSPLTGWVPAQSLFLAKP